MERKNHGLQMREHWGKKKKKDSKRPGTRLLILCASGYRPEAQPSHPILKTIRMRVS